MFLILTFGPNKDIFWGPGQMHFGYETLTYSAQKRPSKLHPDENPRGPDPGVVSLQFLVVLMVACCDTRAQIHQKEESMVMSSFLFWSGPMGHGGLCIFFSK